MEISIESTDAPKQMYGVHELIAGEWNGTHIDVYEVGFCEKQFGTSTNSKSHEVWGANLVKSEEVARQHNGNIPDIQTVVDTIVPFLDANPKERAEVEGKTCYINCDKSEAMDEKGGLIDVHIGRHIATFSIGDVRYNITDICANPIQPVELVFVVNKGIMPPAALIRS